ncbi:MAG: hypothetical protein COZ16_12205 [Flavobacteriaceae bacterium CG_4_10_14_3_um_filter_31_253]|nr:MAG: hypothetical protein COW43_02240 [Flavobacteriaceae bacterium CG17_big_fil_post_rev_8_21_14_2_50_31_13]PIX14630.1 MAG: hypothetical protein COZ74_02420 [Flavobacteriaceae bacterium CG_4_8_14_3_um_filter_31_8]PIY13848.1 MAG: hypothetical protein COZ16_12205 [Flavobacteriaceae bacterium CG_4_10_14_3_um_filter_31_253]PIZ09556.1 MAG: hypothetical protein COY55_12180 [Flavobacteriaceae bacterium CG_4_10_14_0_8_um_filter_31_99]PJC10110.1 MAG: hypothetical protein CO067_06400 [Flavobacteriacea
MNIEKILNGKKYRSLFDKLSDEFDKSPIDNKLNVLASLNYWNLLDQVIKEYQQKYKQQKDKYILDQLKPTLQFLISHLRFGENLALKDFENQNLKKAILELKVELTNKVEKEYSKKTLIKSYLEEDNKVFKQQNDFFKIEFEKDPTNELKERDLKENKPFQESYIHLYNFLINSLIPDYKNNNFQGYSIDMGMSYQTEYLVRFYLQNPSKEKYLKAIQYAINIIYLNKEPYHKFFLFRMNFSENEIVQDFYSKNHIGVRFDTKADMEDWKNLKNGQKLKQQFAQRWNTLNQTVQENDVIVISSYKNFGCKVGIISQGTQFEKIGNENEFYTIFKLEQNQEIDIEKFPFIQTLLPSNVTISPIKRKNYTLRKNIFPKIIVRIENNEFDDIALEIIASEWLRTDFAPKEYRLQYQLLKTGGNNKDIDIYGMTIGNEKLIAQVSSTKDSKNINNKIKKLEKYNGFKRVFFFNVDDKKTSEYEIIDLKRIISELRNDNKYKELIYELE